MTKHFTILIAFLMTIGSQANAFKYKKVFYCGDSTDSLEFFAPYDTQMSRHIIHFGESNEIVIWNDGYQYSTKEKRTYDQLWIQNGAITFLRIKASLANVIQFEMLNEANGWRKLLVLDQSDLTYMVQATWNSKTYDARYGRCVVMVDDQ